jgi:hypothetical protein
MTWQNYFIKHIKQLTFFFIPDRDKLSRFQRKEYSKLWFNLAVLMVGSLIIKTFETTHAEMGIQSLLTIASGLTGFLLCVKVGLYFGKKL